MPPKKSGKEGAEQSAATDSRKSDTPRKRKTLLTSKGATKKWTTRNVDQVETSKSRQRSIPSNKQVMLIRRYRKPLVEQRKENLAKRPQPVVKKNDTLDAGSNSSIPTTTTTERSNPSLSLPIKAQCKKPQSPKKAKATCQNIEKENQKEEPHEQKMDINDNECSGEEADKCSSRTALMKAVGDRLIINGKKYNIKGTIEGDYGWVDIRMDNNPKAFWETYRFETDDAKLKRIKTEAMIFALGAAYSRNHILRMLKKGNDKHLGIKFVITDSLWMTLSEIQHTKFNGMFPKEIALRLCFETFQCISDIHRVGFVHRDVKPSAFAFGREPNQKKMFISNFGLARRYRRHDMTVIEPRPKVPFMGSVKYASRSTHMRMERMIRDDLESWLYVCLEIIEPEVLPWRTMTDRDNALAEKKIFMSFEGFPAAMKKYSQISMEFCSLVRYIDSLEYSTIPKTSTIKMLLQGAMESANLKVNGFLWDWEKIEADMKKSPSDNKEPKIPSPRLKEKEEVEEFDAAEPGEKTERILIGAIMQNCPSPSAARDSVPSPNAMKSTKAEGTETGSVCSVTEVSASCDDTDDKSANNN
ncbi:hypothetical protein QR680_008474 [Steinernema hermaphroditum]|uniref:Protein kinase domain-containing protein n=1 Tax=Steinernema hermaphroditum TaxID=289476 RepID=A0AA39M855_9BILA|nr:hypothetical protein QR680_008474 [Steinernema hermaphroditum]